MIHGLSVPMRGDSLPDKDVNQHYIGVYRTNRYEWSFPLSNNASLGDRIPPPAIIAAIDQGISQAASYGAWENANRRKLAPNCSSNFCEYPHYQSLSINHICNIDLQYSLPSNYGLESELTLGLEDGAMNTTVSFLYPDSAWFEDASPVGPLVANVFILTNMFNEPTAIECALFWTVTDYQSQTSNGNWAEASLALYTTTNDSTALQAAIHPQKGQDIIMNLDHDCWINGSQILSSDQDFNPVLKEDCTYFINATAQQGLQNWLKSPTNGLVSSLSSNGTASNNFITVLDSLFQEWKSDWPMRRNKNWSIQTFLLGNLDYMLFRPLTTSLTSSIRTLPRGALFGQYTWGQLSAGIMYDSFRFRVLWPIMIFPALLVVGAAMFTALVAVRARDHLWRKRVPCLLCFLGLGGELESTLIWLRRLGVLGSNWTWEREVSGWLRLVMERGREFERMGSIIEEIGE